MEESIEDNNEGRELNEENNENITMVITSSLGLGVCLSGLQKFCYVCSVLKLSKGLKS